MGRVIITITSGVGRGAKLHWCDQSHFKSGAAEMNSIRAKIESTIPAKVDASVKKSLRCHSCGKRCTNVLALLADVHVHFCMAACLVDWVSTCGVGAWKELCKKRKANQ
jgi:hypothetical protein